MSQNLEHTDGALVMPEPKAFVKQNQLHDGSQVPLPPNGSTLPPNTQTRRPRYQLQDLLAEMPDDLPMVAGWDEMVAVGKEAA